MRRIKLVLLGGAGVGKTSLLRRFCQNKFNPAQPSTLGAAFGTIHFREKDDGTLDIATSAAPAPPNADPRLWCCECWDTAGQERYRALLPMYFRGADIPIFVHDGTVDSVKAATTYYADLERHRRHEQSRCLVAFWRNKIDLENTPNAPLSAQISEAINQQANTSAKTGYGVHRSFLALLQDHVARARSGPSPPSPAPGDKAPVGHSQRQHQPRCCEMH